MMKRLCLASIFCCCLLWESVFAFRSNDGSSQGNLSSDDSKWVTTNGPALSFEETSLTQVATYVLFFASVFILANVTQFFLGRVLCFELPISVALFLLGMVMSAFTSYVVNTNGVLGIFGYGVVAIEQMNHYVVFLVFLPICLYDASSRLAFHVFKRAAASSLLLALPGVALNTFLMALFFKFWLGSPFTWSGSLMVGAILSATDPVAVMAGLHSLHAPHRLSGIVEGESLFNDGSAVVLFELFHNMLAGYEPTAFHVVSDFFRLAVLGPALGILFGVLAYYWMRSVRAHVVLQVTTIVGLLYLLYSGSEYFFHSSGVLTVVTFGLTVSGFAKAGFSRSTHHLHEDFMTVLSSMADQALFLCAGVLTGKYLRNVKLQVSMFLNTIVLYLVALAARFVVLFAFFPLLRNLGYRMTVKEGAILVWGALRGAVALALAIVIDNDTRLDMEFRSQATFFIAAFTMMTLLVNGTTVKTLYKRLNMYTTSPSRRRYFNHTLKEIERNFQEEVVRLRELWFFDGKVLDYILSSMIVPNLAEGTLNSSGDLCLEMATPSKRLWKNLRPFPCFVSPSSCLEKNLKVPRHSNIAVKRISVNSALSKLSGGNTPKSLNCKLPHADVAVSNVIEIIIHGTKQTYQRLYAEHAIEGEALLVLHAAADTALDAVSPWCDSKSKSPFRIEWEALSSEFTALRGWDFGVFGRLFIVRKFIFQKFSRNVEMLFAYVTAYEELLENEEQQDKKQFLALSLGTTKINELYFLLSEARKLLQQALQRCPWLGANAMAKIQAQFLLENKIKVAKAALEEGFVLEEDVEKLTSLLFKQHSALRRYVPPRMSADWLK